MRLLASRKRPWTLFAFAALPSAVLLSATACTTPTAPTVVESSTVACVGFQPIYAHDDDTQETKDQIDVHNEVWEHLCKGAKQ